MDSNQMNSENNIIKIEHVSKKYRLGMIGGTTLRDEIHRKTAKLLHKEDPTLIIGQKPVIGNEEFYALTDISLTIQKGEALGIIGRNGAGKSTLLKLLCRVTAPTEGKISYNGRITSMLEVGTGFHPELTGRENIYLNGAILGMNRKEIDSKIENIIDFSECRQFIDTPVKRYSSGMKVKLAFSVSAHLDSEIMIMDEVLAVGDVAFQKKCLDKMREATNREGRTVLYVSHNMNTIRQLCDRCIVLDKGQIAFDGDVEAAIDIYMSTIELSECVVNLSDMQRSNQFSNHVITMEQLVVDADNSVFQTGSVLEGCFHIYSDRQYNKLRLEIPVRSTNGISAARFSSDSCVNLSKGENTIGFSLDISRLAPGRYTLNPVIREINEFGGQRNLDGLVEVFCFEIVPSAGFNNGSEWNTYYSGYYVPPKIQIRQ